MTPLKALCDSERAMEPHFEVDRVASESGLLVPLEYRVRMKSPRDALLKRCRIYPASLRYDLAGRQRRSRA